MRRRMTTTIGHRVVRAEGTAARRRQGHVVTLAIVAAIGIAAGTILMLTIDGKTSGEPETVAVENRHIVSSVTGRTAAYALPDGADLVAEEDIGLEQNSSAAPKPELRSIENAVRLDARKEPRLADRAIVTSSTNIGQTDGISLPEPAPERFGGALPVGEKRKFPIPAEAVGDRDTGPTAVNSEPAAADRQTADLTRTETAVLAVEREPEVSAARQSEPAGTPVSEAIEPEVRLWKGRVRKYVNLRSGPDNDAPVLAVIPPNAQVLAQKNCVHWCRASYKDQNGYVYRSLVRHPGKNSKRAGSAVRNSAKKTQVPAVKSEESVGQTRLVEIGR